MMFAVAFLTDVWPCSWKAHARRTVCMAVEIPLLAKFGYEATEESVHQHSVLTEKLGPKSSKSAFH